MTAETLAQRFRRGRSELGPLRLALYLAITAVILAKIVLYFTLGEPNRSLHALAAVVTSLWAAERFLDQPKPDRLWGSVLAVGAALLWAQVFGLLPYPIQGAN